MYVIAAIVLIALAVYYFCFKKNEPEKTPVRDYDKERWEQVSAEELVALEEQGRDAVELLRTNDYQSPGWAYPDGFLPGNLKPFSYFISAWRNTRQNERLTLFFPNGDSDRRDRARIRISLNVYMELGVKFPRVMIDYFESLTQMDTGDAVDAFTQTS